MSIAFLADEEVGARESTTRFWRGRLALTAIGVLSLFIWHLPQGDDPTLEEGDQSEILQHHWWRKALETWDRSISHSLSTMHLRLGGCTTFGWRGSVDCLCYARYY